MIRVVATAIGVEMSSIGETQTVMSDPAINLSDDDQDEVTTSETATGSTQRTEDDALMESDAMSDPAINLSDDDQDEVTTSETATGSTQRTEDDELMESDAMSDPAINIFDDDQDEVFAYQVKESEMAKQDPLPVEIAWDDETAELLCPFCEGKIGASPYVDLQCDSYHIIHNRCLQELKDFTYHCPICFGEVVSLEDGSIDFKPRMTEEELVPYKWLRDHFKNVLGDKLKSVHFFKAYGGINNRPSRMCYLFIKKILIVNVRNPAIESLRNAAFDEESSILQLLPEFLYEACLFDKQEMPSNPRGVATTICKFVEAAVYESRFCVANTRLRDNVIDRIKDWDEKVQNDRIAKGLDPLEDGDVGLLESQFSNIRMADGSPEPLLCLDTRRKELILNMKSSTFGALNVKDSFGGIADEVPVIALFAAILANEKVPPRLLQLADVLFGFAEAAINESRFQSW